LGEIGVGVGCCGGAGLGGRLWGGAGGGGQEGGGGEGVEDLFVGLGGFWEEGLSSEVGSLLEFDFFYWNVLETVPAL
jgi:hypothetical protein